MEAGKGDGEQLSGNRENIVLMYLHTYIYLDGNMYCDIVNEKYF